LNTPRLYHVPPQPGFLGGFDPKPFVFSLLLLTVVCIGATQYLAWSFGYQPALGEPLWTARSHHFAIYTPWRWIKWCWTWRHIQTESVATPIKFATIGGITGLAVALAFSSSSPVDRARKLSQGTAQLHGSASWAAAGDVEATGLLSSSEGVYVGAWQDGGRVSYLRDNTDQHVLAFAPSGSGKGVGLVIPTLLGWQWSAVIYDIKGENWTMTAGYRQQCGHICFKFAPVSQEACSRFNPLEEVRLFTPRDVSDAQNIAHMLVRTGQDAPQEKYWQDAAASLLTGMIMHICYAAHSYGRTASLSDLAAVLTPTDIAPTGLAVPGQQERQQPSFERLLRRMLTYAHDPDGIAGWGSVTHPVVREKALEMLDKEDKDFSGVHSTAKTCLSLYADPVVAVNTSISDFEIRDLVDFHIPISLYLVVPPSDEIRLRPLIRLIFTMIVNRLTESIEYDGAQLVPNRQRLLFLIDEFPSLRHMEIFAGALSFMRGYGLKAYLIAQDIRQIIDSYGPNESIVSNCHIRVAFAPNQIETAEMLSKMLGQRTIEKASYSFSGRRRAWSLHNMTASVEQVERPLLTADEVGRLPSEAALVFTTGQRPIYCRKIRYFDDPEFARRASISPHRELVRIVPNLHQAPDAEPEPVPAAEPVRSDWPV